MLKVYLRFNSSIKGAIKRNRKQVVQFNKTILGYLLIIMCALLIIPSVAGSLRIGYEANATDYIGALLIYLFMLLLYKRKAFDEKPEIGLYIGFVVVFALNTYLSVIGSPTHRASVILGAFCLIPLCIIDDISRISCFMVVFYGVHTALSFHYKGTALGWDDAINCLCYLILGVFVGGLLQQTRLNSFELARRLTRERETDVLTGLKNRRKLFELFVQLEKGEKERPTGAFMMDIDNFKLYNDQHGHAAGDAFLSAFGAELLRFEKQADIAFYRYGGEEFAAFAWGYDKNELRALAEEVRIAVEGIFDEWGGRTLSIGYTDCAADPSLGYEALLKQADEAAYQAKSQGRNQVVFFGELN